MKKNKILHISLGLFMLCILAFTGLRANADTTDDGIWTRYQNSATNNGVTEHPGPTDASRALSLWVNNIDVSTAKTPPLIVGNYIYTASGNKVYRLDKKTGEQLKASDALKGSVGFGLHPMVYAKGKLFVMTNVGGMVYIEAVNATTLKKEWTSNGVAGDIYSPLTYHEFENGKGYLYTGTWTGAGKKGFYFCVAAEQNDKNKAGDIVWQKEYTYGFYWDGAYISENFMVFASENSESDRGTVENSTLYVVNPLTGATIDSISNLSGNIRNTITYDNEYLYFATMTGRLYRIQVNNNSGELIEPETGYRYIDLGGPVRTTPIVYNQNRIYVGVGSNGSNSARYVVIQINEDGTMSELDSINVAGDPTGTPLLSTAENRKSPDAPLYMYYTCNVHPGGIYYFTVDPTTGKITSSANTLFTPADSQQQFSISSLALDQDGTLYYKNDSNYVMAIAPKLLTGLKVTPNKGSVNWKDNFQPGVKEYWLTVGDNVENLKFEINGSDASSDFKVGTNDQGTNNTVSLTSDQTEVVLTLTRGAITATYTFHIKKVTRQDTSLGLLHFGAKGVEEMFGTNLLQPISDSRTEYSVDLRKTPADNNVLWIRSLHSQAEVAVYAVENLKKENSDAELKAGKELLFDDIDAANTYKYTINPVDSSKNTVIKVRITSADGRATKDYQVSFIRTDAQKPQQPVTPPTPTPTPIPSTQSPQTNTQPAVTDNNTNQAAAPVPISKPKKVTGVKVKKSKKKVTFSWKKIKGVSGYQITVAKDKKFKKAKKQFTISKASISKKKVKLTSKMKYVRVRAFNKKNGQIVYGAYSKVVKIK